MRGLIAGKDVQGHPNCEEPGAAIQRPLVGGRHGRLSPAMPNALESTRQRPGAAGGFFAGARAVFAGARLVAGDPKLRKLTAVPIVLTGALYALLVGLVLFFSDDVLRWLVPEPDNSWLLALWYVAWVLGMLSIFLIAALLFTTVNEVVGGPFYERMAEDILTRHNVPTEKPTFVDGTILDIVRSLLFVVPAAIFAVMGFIPGIGFPLSLVGVAIAWIGFGSSAMNPALLVTGHRFGARLSYVWKNFATILGLGSVVALSLAIPLLPLISIPCSIAGASDLYGRGER